MYDAFIWTCIALAAVQYIVTGDGAAGVVAFLLILIQFGRLLRNRRQMVF